MLIARSIVGTSRASGPTQSRVVRAGRTPVRLTRPNEGFSPYTPQHAAGMRMEPPVSLPSAKSTRPAATATAEPLEEPPGTRPGARGLRGVPAQRLIPVTP
jgi:hypothetical protein